MRRGALDEFDREFSAGATPEPGAEPIGNSLREPARVCSPRCTSALDGSFDELPVSDAVAYADVHAPFGSATLKASVNEND